MLGSLRPLLFPSRPEDPPQRAGFGDGVELVVPGGGAAVERVGGRLYLALSLRNVGTGIAVLHGGRIYPGRRTARVDPAALDEFRLLTRDLYIPPGDLGFWQTAFRDPAEPALAEALPALREGVLTVDLLYGDYEGGQRVVSRFGVLREGDGGWRLTGVRHWQLDRADPRVAR